MNISCENYNQPVILGFCSLPLSIPEDDRDVLENWNSNSNNFVYLTYNEEECKNNEISNKSLSISSISNKLLLKKYFHRWKNFTDLQKSSDEKIKKINNLIDEICRYKQNCVAQTTANEQQPTPKRKKIMGESYRNRFEAQQTLIEIQKAKITEQTKLINDLKLGIIRDEISESMKNTRSYINQTLSNCSVPAKLKIGPQLVDIESGLLRFMVDSNKAPKFVQKMEQRAYERARNREIILQRKRLMDAEKQRILQEQVESKRVQDEEEKRRNLEAIKERQRKELELQKIRQANKEAYFANLQKAEKFHRRKLLRTVFRRFVSNLFACRQNYEKSVTFYDVRLLQNAFKTWTKHIEDLDNEINAVADTFYAKKLAKQALDMWLQFRKERIQATQVAEDFHDFQTTRKHFVHWHRYVCTQYIQMERKKVIADVHYKSRTLLQCFYQWKSLPAVMQLEKTKEERKKKWREKVWEILPDFKPPKDD